MAHIVAAMINATATTPATTPPAIAPVLVVDFVVVLVTVAPGADTVVCGTGSVVGSVEVAEVVEVVCSFVEADVTAIGLILVGLPPLPIHRPPPVLQHLSATVPAPQQ